ncbi:magnesium-transporting ATPase (P-type) [Nocardia kruczakiae]|uniref:Magnesium-transporting ATPase (P-type) n=1 Tax=Nocardia kruczakiae TaxID=261477 RepID=A0ABU1X966_9NOCA|nr:hypothetical protein [Nocardia kruczakiae]MDR7167084.1 magnesium-transporting ATPase (P-type) [Nocardia kruczakiae]
MNVASPGVGSAVVCLVLVAASAAVYRFAYLGSMLIVPGAAVRAIVQLSVVALVLAAALRHLWSSFLVLGVMFAAAVQILVLLGLLLAQSCAVAVTIELVARGRIRRPRH